MLTNTVKDLLHTNALVVVIGARGTGKSYCAKELQHAWQALNIEVLHLDAGGATRAEDLDVPLAAALRCSPGALHPRSLPAETVLRVIVDRCETLYDRRWFSSMQERWRSLLSDKESQGRISAVFLGRPQFRQIAGGDASPLLNLGPVVTPEPWTVHQVQSLFGVDDQCAKAVWRKTGGHQKLTNDLVQAIACDQRKMGAAIGPFLGGQRTYIARMVQDFRLEARSALVDLMSTKGPVQMGALIQRHFGSAHADGLEAIQDLTAAGLVGRIDEDKCALRADILLSVEGLKGFAKARAVEAPKYHVEATHRLHHLIYRAENNLRLCVEDALHSTDPMWWLQRVSPETRALAEGRQTAEAAALGIGSAENHPIMYLSLGELFDLVLQRENWQGVFHAVFPVGESAIKDASTRLGAIRNRLAHSRPIEDEHAREAEQIIQRLSIDG